MKMLLFEVSATDSICIPAKNVYMIEATGANAGVLYFHPGGITSGNGTNGTIVFNSSTGNLTACITELGNMLNANMPLGGVIEVANTTAGRIHKGLPSLVLTNLAIAVTQ